MREIFYTSTFEKDLKTVRKYSSFKADKLKSYINKLANGEKLPESAHDHKMKITSPKKYQGMRDFHIAPDIVVVYKIDDTSISLIRIGQHNHLGLTENF
jgi:mRNA interferase YafQ